MYKLKLFKLNVYSNLIPGVLAVGLFAQNPYPLDTTNGRSGLFEGECTCTNITYKAQHTWRFF